MALRSTFRGGVHPCEQKDRTEGKPIRTLPPPATAVVPLRQHIGAPARAVVKPGDVVAEGQPVGEASGFVSVPIHSPMAGCVKAVEPRPHPGGVTSESVVIEALPEGEEAPAPWRIEGITNDIDGAVPNHLRQLIRQGGLVGMGGAAFPTHVKLSPPPEKPIDVLIINGAECEPYLTCDHRVMLEETDDVVTGVRIFQRILGVQTVLIGIEDNKPDAIQVMKKAFAGVAGVLVKPCKVKYPQGGEKQLIKALTGREVPPPPGLPMDVGVVVQNVGTAAAVARAVTQGIPFMERVVTISGSLVANPSNLRVRIGTPLDDLVKACGGLAGDPARVIMGGPMMGCALADLSVPVVKATSGFVFFAKSEVPDLEPSPCIRCGRCCEACPLGMLPGETARRIELGMLDEAHKFNVKECMECGSCSYICPSNRWLVQLFRIGKAKLNERNRKA